MAIRAFACSHLKIKRASSLDEVFLQADEKQTFKSKSVFFLRFHNKEETEMSLENSPGYLKSS